MTAILCSNFDLAVTLDSGQLFRWVPLILSPEGRGQGEGFRGWIGGQSVCVSQRDSQLLFQGASPAKIRRFFSLDVDLKSVALQIDRDEIIHEALTRYGGLRVVRQEPWECLVSFILSSFNNIPRLTGMIERLCLRFGDPFGVPQGPPLVARPAQHRSSRPSEAGLTRGSGLAPDQIQGDFRPCPARPAHVLDRVMPLQGGPLHQGPPEGTGVSRPSRSANGAGSSFSFIPLSGVSARASAGPRWGPDSVSANPRTRGRSLGSGQSGAGDGACYQFPRPEVLARVSERALRNCGLGFRAPYIKEAAQAVASRKVDLEGLRDLKDDALRRALLEIPGVGEKVAECVALFAYERTSAFPVDVWIGRAMRRWYFPKKRRVANREIRAFALRHFGSHCGWAQQYLYCLAREGSSRISLDATAPSAEIS